MFSKWMGVGAATLLGAALLAGSMGFAAPSGAAIQPLTDRPMITQTRMVPAPSTWMSIRVNGTDLDGDGAPEDRKGQIEVLAFEQSVLTAREAGSGLATGRRQYQPLLIRKRIDKSSPLLMKALTQNSVVEATFGFYRPDPMGTGEEERFYAIEIRNARVASVKIVQEGNEPPMEEITFVFHTITWTYTNGGVTHEDTWDQQR